MATTTSLTTVEEKSSKISFEIDQKCPIQFVTVYNDRAEVTRSLKHHFDAEGTFELVLQGFSPSVDLNSLHVSGGTGKACTILEVSYQTRYEENTTNERMTPVDQLRNDFEQIQIQLNRHQQELGRLTKQRTWLDGRATKLMNQDGQIQNQDLETMQQFLEFYSKNLNKLDDETTREETEIKHLTQRRDELNVKINEHGAQAQAKRRKTIREVTVAVHINTTNIDVSLEVAYLISQCSWSASYDVRVNNSDTAQQKTQLTYYGIIVNQSQENWTNVQLALSTATPSLGGTAPKLNTLRVAYYTPPTPHYDYDRFMAHSLALEDCGVAESPMLLKSASLMKKSRSFALRGRKQLASKEEASANDEEDEPNTVNVLETKTEASFSSASFTIPRRATIEADGKPHKVTIGVLDLTSTFTYTVIPKLSLHAFLKAKTTNSSDKQLLAGPASVFMDNNFVTHSSIENVCLGDTFDLPLGTDASVKVEYKPVKKTADTQGLISKVKYENIRHETRLTNTKSTEVTVYVYEQVPLSSLEKIKVKLNVPDLRNKDHGGNSTVTLNDSNILEWKCVLPAKGECRLPTEYTIEWPKDKRIEFKDNN